MKHTCLQSNIFTHYILADVTKMYMYLLCRLHIFAKNIASKHHSEQTCKVGKALKNNQQRIMNGTTRAEFLKSLLRWRLIYFFWKILNVFFFQKLTQKIKNIYTYTFPEKLFFSGKNSLHHKIVILVWENWQSGETVSLPWHTFYTLFFFVTF